GGFGGMWGPNVLTNATVQFKDAETSQIIDEVDSGVPFKLVITISGNNVYQNWGSNSTTYRVEVTDDLFLLTDFRNNGFKDNAKSNGFTIHYDAKTGKRYIDFKIANGATKTITLNAMFANGVTEDGHKTTVKVVSVSNNSSVSGTITANAEFKWTDNKTQNFVELTTVDFSSGSVEYVLSAQPAYANDGVGDVWATELNFTDTVTLPSGMTFESAPTLEVDGKQYTGTVSADKTSATFTWAVPSQYIGADGKPYADMDKYEKTAKLYLSGINIPSTFDSGTLTNTLSGTVKPYSGNSVPIGDATVTAPVKAVKPDFSVITKAIDYDGKSYYMTGNELVFTISTQNKGAQGDVTLTDELPEGLTLVKVTDITSNGVDNSAGNNVSITWKNVPANGVVSAKVHCMVSWNGEADTTLTNTVKNDYGYSATAYVPVKPSKSSIAVTKTASPTTIINDVPTDIRYRIVISNTGTVDLTGVKLEDYLSADLAAAEITSITSSDGTVISATSLDGTSQVLLSGLTIPVGGSITVDMTVKTTASADFTNTAAASATGVDTVTDDVEITVKTAEPVLNVSKFGYVLNDGVQQDYYQEVEAGENNQKIVYIINVYNSGDGAATNVVVTDEMVQTMSKNNGTYTVEGVDVADDGTWTIASIAPGQSAQVKVTITPKVRVGSQGNVFLKNAVKVGDITSPDAVIPFRENKAKVTINKTALKATYVAASKEVEELFEIVVSNTGTKTAKDVEVKDPIDPNTFSDVEYSIDGGEWNSWEGSVTLDLEPNTTIRIVLRGKLTEKAAAETTIAVNTVVYYYTEPNPNYDAQDGTDSSVYEYSGKAEATIHPTTFTAVKDFEKTATVDGTAGGALDVSGGMIVYDLTYGGGDETEARNYVSDGTNTIVFPITFTDYLPLSAEKSIYWNVEKVELLTTLGDDENGTIKTDTIEVKDYVLTENVLTYTSNTQADKTVLRIYYKVNSLVDMEGGAPLELVNAASVSLAGESMSDDEITPVVDKNAMKVDKFAKVDGSMDEAPDPMDAGVIDHEEEVVGFDNTITNYIKITNTSDKDWNTLNLYDYFSGSYLGYSKMNVKVVSIADASGEPVDSVITAGDVFSTKSDERGKTVSSSADTQKDYDAVLTMGYGQDGADEDNNNNYNNNNTADGTWLTKNTNHITLALFCSDDVLIPVGAELVLAYQITTSNIDFSTGYPGKFETGSNTVYASYNGNVDDLMKTKSYFTDTISYVGASPTVFKSVGAVTDEGYRYAFNDDLESLVVPMTYDADNLSSYLEQQEFQYTVSIYNKNDSHVDFDEDIVYVIKDMIPEGMELIESSVVAGLGSRGYMTYLATPGYGKFEDKTTNRVPSDYISFEYNNEGTSVESIVIKNVPLSETNKNNADFSSLMVFYKLKLSANKINEIVKSGDSVNEVFTNVASVSLYENYGRDNESLVVSTNEDTATVTLYEESVAPDVEKTSKTEDNIVMPDFDFSSGIEWTVTVYNGNGDAANKEEGTKLADLTGYTISDTLPAGTKYYGSAVGNDAADTIEKNGYTNYMHASYTIYDLTKNNDGSVKKTPVSSDIGKVTPTVDGTTVANPDQTDGKTLVFTADEKMKLSANQCIEISFNVSNAVLTTIDEEKYYVPILGTEQNTVSVKFDQSFSRKTVEKGTYVGDKTIEDTATHQMGGINTESYETITYNHQDVENSPATAWGYGDLLDHEQNANRFGTEILKSALNYVQGLQTHPVTYTLNVKNNATADTSGSDDLSERLYLENFVIIDRLAYIGDTGLISGYPRNTAFPLTFDPDSLTVTLDGQTVSPSKYQITYSDSTATLSEYDSDWTGGNGAMNWVDTYDSTMKNFRIMFSEDFLVPEQSEMQVVFDCYVPAYVEAIGEDNIAWNSFSYAYQSSNPKTGIGSGASTVSEFMNDAPKSTANGGVVNYINAFRKATNSTSSVMVSEPAMVGVWVPATNNQITVNKTYVTNSTEENTFYFTLFTLEDGNYVKFSEPQALTMTASADNVPETVEFKNLQNPGAIYLFETDAEGNILTSTPQQIITYNGVEMTGVDAEGLGNVLLAEPAAEAQAADDEVNSITVNITNTANVGSIDVTKTFIPAVTGNKQTFYFGVFTWNAESVTFEKSPYAEIQSLTMQGKEAGVEVTDTLTFKNLPVGSTYYVIETDENGEPQCSHVDDLGGYGFATSDNRHYDVTTTVGSGDGTAAQAENFGIVLTDDDNPKSVAIRNEELLSYVINVSKIYDGEDADAAEFTFGLYQKSAAQPAAENEDPFAGYEAVYGTGDEPGQLKHVTVTVKNGETAEINVTPYMTRDDEGEYGEFYVFELDADGKPMPQGGSGTTAGGVKYYVDYGEHVEINDVSDPDSGGAPTYQYTYVAESLSEINAAGNVVISNTTKENTFDAEITVSKALLVSGYDAAELSGKAEMTFGLFTGKVETAENGEQAMQYTKVEGVDNITITIDGVAGEGEYSGSGKFSLTGLEAETDGTPNLYQYYVFELDKNGDPIFTGNTVEMTIGSKTDKATVTYATEAGVVISAVNPAGTTEIANILNEEKTISFSKWTDSNERLANAKMQLTGDMTNVTVITEDGKEVEYTIEGDTLTWTTTEDDLVVKGMNGKYTLSETDAPDYYKAITPAVFTVANGMIEMETAETSSDCVLTANSVSASDKLVTVTISKIDITNSKELEGATLTITSEEDLSGVKATRNGADFELTYVEGGISFTSGTVPTRLSMLPAGDYTLTEMKVPTDEDGKAIYQQAEAIDFTVNEDGTITIGETANSSSDAELGLIVMADDLISVEISKVDITDGSELKDAELMITAVDTVIPANISLTRNGEAFTDYTIDNGTLSFKSGEFSTIIKGLTQGEYTLTEVTAPAGFIKKTESVTFTINEFGKVEGTTTLENEPVKVTISKYEMVDGEETEVPGATLTITGESDIPTDIVLTRG
ncbi:MAG: DUF11 domain-containing protein, partial [Oscillospiraceae bacterium]|nr:DUF11 domain-containing protein [Oscillospiraceae bacterium]